MLKDYLHLHFLILLWGFTALIGKDADIPAVELVFYRTLVAAAGLAVVLAFKKVSFKLSAASMAKMVATGFLVSLHWITFFASAQVSMASICLAGMATCTLWTSILEPLIMRRGVRWYEVLLGVIIIFGLYIILHFQFNHFVGLAMAVFSAVCVSLFTIINGKFSKQHDPYLITFYEMIGAFICTLIFLPIYTEYFAKDHTLHMVPTVADWGRIAMLALVCTVYAYSVSVEMMKRISPFAMNLSVNMEPVYGIALAALFYNENDQVTLGFYGGTAIILFAVVIYPVLKKIDERRLRAVHAKQLALVSEEVVADSYNVDKK